MKITEDTDGENGWFIEDDKGRRIAGLFHTKVAAERWIKWVNGRGANTNPWSALAKESKILKAKAAIVRAEKLK